MDVTGAASCASSLSTTASLATFTTRSPVPPSHVTATRDPAGLRHMRATGDRGPTTSIRCNVAPTVPLAGSATRSYTHTVPVAVLEEGSTVHTRVWG